MPTGLAEAVNTGTRPEDAGPENVGSEVNLMPKIHAGQWEGSSAPNTTCNHESLDHTSTPHPACRKTPLNFTGALHDAYEEHEVPNGDYPPGFNDSDDDKI